MATNKGPAMPLPTSTFTILEGTTLQTIYVTSTSGVIPQLSLSLTYSATPSSTMSTSSPASTTISPPSSSVTSTLSTSSAVFPSSSAFSSPLVTTPQTAAPLPTYDAVSTSSIQSNTPTATSRSVSEAASLSRSHSKQAIIGGLAGAIVGLVMVGVLIFCFLRRRRQWKGKDPEPIDHSAEEKGIRPVFKRKWTGLTGRGTPRQTLQMASIHSPVTVDEEHHIIRMSTQHWSRPYAKGTGEGYRESMPPGALRVMNPDAPRPGSLISSATAPSFLAKQRSALAAMLLGNASGTRVPSHSGLDSPDPKGRNSTTPLRDTRMPEAAHTAPALSTRFYPSVTSLSVVQQEPPEDPFITPPDEKSAAGIAQRTLSHVLQPFRSRSGQDLNTTPATHRWPMSTFEARASVRDTGYSDQFDLDRPSLRFVPSIAISEAHTVGPGRSNG